MELDKDFKEFIELLNVHKVKYLVVGGYAVNFHGYPRYTKDIDFWLWLHPDNINNLMRAIKDFGFGELGLSLQDFLDPENIVQLGYEPNRIDMIMDINGVDFQDCFQRRCVAELDGVVVNFLSLNDLLDNKRQTKRLQDLADAEQLEWLRNNNSK